jgi:hypothetical protein
MVRMKHRDYEFDDDEVFDRRYYPKLVYKDGYGPHVSLMLTDAMHREVATRSTAASPRLGPAQRRRH